jgi:hypothetical protein
MSLCILKSQATLIERSAPAPALNGGFLHLYRWFGGKPIDVQLPSQNAILGKRILLRPGDREAVRFGHGVTARPDDR